MKSFLMVNHSHSIWKAAQNIPPSKMCRFTADCEPEILVQWVKSFAEESSWETIRRVRKSVFSGCCCCWHPVRFPCPLLPGWVECGGGYLEHHPWDSFGCSHYSWDDWMLGELKKKIHFQKPSSCWTFFRTRSVLMNYLKYSVEMEHIAHKFTWWSDPWVFILTNTSIFNTLADERTQSLWKIIASHML